MKVKFLFCSGFIYLPFQIFLHLLVLCIFVFIQTLWEPVLMQVLSWCCSRFFCRIWWCHSKNSKCIIVCPQSLNNLRHPLGGDQMVINENSSQSFYGIVLITASIFLLHPMAGIRMMSLNHSFMFYVLLGKWIVAFVIQYKPLVSFTFLHYHLVFGRDKGLFHQRAVIY